MVTLQYFTGKEWVDCGHFDNEHIAWISLGGDDFNYRTVDKELDKVLTDKSEPERIAQERKRQNYRR